MMKHGPISVLHFTNATARAGAEEHILTLLRGLDRQHFRLNLVCDPEIADLMRTSASILCATPRLPTSCGPMCLKMSN
jgi:hypothetical protein